MKNMVYKKYLMMKRAKQYGMGENSIKAEVCPQNNHINFYEMCRAVSWYNI